MGWEIGTTGNNGVLLMPMGHQRCGASNGLEDGLLHFKSSEVLDEPHRAFLGSPVLAQSCLAMLKSESACWSLRWRPRWRGPGDRRHSPGEQQASFSQLVAWPKLLAEVSGVSWDIRIHWVSGSWVGGVRQGPMITDLPGWKLHHCPFGLCCAACAPYSLSRWLSAPDVQWVSCCCWPRSGREHVSML